MRPLSGFDKPLAQWLLLAGCAVLIVLVLLATRSVQRATRQAHEVAAAWQEDRADLQSLESQLARERATREALSLEVARLRARLPTEEDAAASTPTLTLLAPATRTGTPPEPTVAAPDRSQPVELRLVLPESVGQPLEQVQVNARDWSTGTLRWSRAGVPLAVLEGRRTIVLYVTGEMLPPGAYELAVTAPANEAAPPEVVASFEVGIRPP